MNYTEFVNAVKEKLTQELNGGVRVNVYTTKKNNATERTGLILETPGVNISPTIYLEEFFELYEKGKQMDWIIEDLVGLYEEIRQEKSWDYERMLSFEGVKDRIIFRLINTEKNKELLLDVPHREFLDLSLVFAVLVEADNDADQRSAYETMEGDKRTALECGKRKYKASASGRMFRNEFCSV